MTAARLRCATASDEADIWRLLEPIFRAGDTYAIDRDISKTDALAYWMGGTHKAYVMEAGGVLVGTYFVCPNQAGGGAHVCNAGFATSVTSRGRGLARQMLEHALAEARATGFEAMQFNFVVETNHAARHIWAQAGFAEVGRAPRAFRHPTSGYVDALILYKFL